MIVDYRASKILFNFLTSQTIDKPFLLPTNVCSVVPLTFYLAGVKFEFVDIQDDNLCIDQDFVLQNLDIYSGVLFVRTYGIEDDFTMLFKQIKEIKNDFLIIDDSCLSKPDFSNKHEYIDLKLFSLGYAKYLDIGIGAFAYINLELNYKIKQTIFVKGDFKLYENKLKQNILSGEKFEFKEYQFLENKLFNLNLQEINSKLNTIVEHKADLNEIYTSNLPSYIQLDSKFQKWRFNIVVNENIKQNILNKLFSNKLFASSHYYPLGSIMTSNKYENSMKLYGSVINLFNDLYYTKEQALKTCEIINSSL